MRTNRSVTARAEGCGVAVLIALLSGCSSAPTSSPANASGSAGAEQGGAASRGGSSGGLSPATGGTPTSGGTPSSTGGSSGGSGAGGRASSSGGIAGGSPHTGGAPSGGNPGTGASSAGGALGGQTAAGASNSGSAGGPFAEPANCTSGVMWNGRPGSAMTPGEPCLGCHVFTFGGTVYASGHEPDGCNGVGPSANTTVVITDSNGTVVRLNLNSAGNFYANSVITAPYTAQVVSAKGTRAMLTPQTNGDCNSCHTQAGLEGAPGRIVAP